MEREAFVTINAVIFPDPDTNVWVAQCLDYDICVQADTLEEVHDAFEKALAATAFTSIMLGQKPFDGIEQAPKKFWDMFDHAKKSPPLRHPRVGSISGS